MFNIGDVVQVKSGGPAMTVLSDGDQVECVWFAEVAEVFHREKLPAICLEAVEFEEDDKENAEDEDEDEDDKDEDEDDKEDKKD
ncbi:MAG: hypothetical protein FD175_703 [Beijerinckiaceae bacterium]|nr:MAG: hypothetical protein FD175_703 [Beijerinckiaceae bacterium]